MKKATVYIIILGILCTGLGVACGMVIERKRTAKNFPQILRHQLMQHPQGAEALRSKLQGAHRERMQKGAAQIFQRIQEELNLNDEQKEQVKGILDQTKEKVEVAQQGFRETLEQAKENSHNQILQLLDPQQQEKFNEITAKMEERRAQFKEKMKGRRSWQK